MRCKLEAPTIYLRRSSSHSIHFHFICFLPRSALCVFQSLFCFIIRSSRSERTIVVVWSSIGLFPCSDAVRRILCRMTTACEWANQSIEKMEAFVLSRNHRGFFLCVYSDSESHGIIRRNLGFCSTDFFLFWGNPRIGGELISKVSSNAKIIYFIPRHHHKV